MVPQSTGTPALALALLGLLQFGGCRRSNEAPSVEPRPAAPAIAARESALDDLLADAPLAELLLGPHVSDFEASVRRGEAASPATRRAAIQEAVLFRLRRQSRGLFVIAGADFADPASAAELPVALREPYLRCAAELGTEFVLRDHARDHEFLRDSEAPTSDTSVLIDATMKDCVRPQAASLFVDPARGGAMSAMAIYRSVEWLEVRAPQEDDPVIRELEAQLKALAEEEAR